MQGAYCPVVQGCLRERKHLASEADARLFSGTGELDFTADVRALEMSGPLTLTVSVGKVPVGSLRMSGPLPLFFFLIPAISSGREKLLWALPVKCTGT